MVFLVAGPLGLALWCIWAFVEVLGYIFELVDALIGWIIQTAYESRVTKCLKKCGRKLKDCINA